MENFRPLKIALCCYVLIIVRVEEINGKPSQLEKAFSNDKEKYENMINAENVAELQNKICVGDVKELKKTVCVDNVTGMKTHHLRKQYTELRQIICIDNPTATNGDCEVKYPPIWKLSHSLFGAVAKGDLFVRFKVSQSDYDDTRMTTWYWIIEANLKSGYLHFLFTLKKCRWIP